MAGAARRARGQRRVPAAEPDQRLAVLGQVRHVEHPGDHQPVVARLDPLAGLALDGGEAAVGDQRARPPTAPVRHPVQHQPRARPAGRREPAGQGSLAGREHSHGEPVYPAEQLGRVGTRDQRDQHQRRVEGHRAERAHGGADVITVVGHRDQGDPGRERRGHAGEGRAGPGRDGAFRHSKVHEPGSVSGPYGDRPAWVASRQTGPQVSASSAASGPAPAGRAALVSAEADGRSRSSGATRG